LYTLLNLTQTFFFYFFKFPRDGRDDLTDKIDFIVCLGGDGTLLYASLLFQQSVPPVMAFHLGSLGFLTPFQIDNFQEQVTNVLEGHAALTLRSRLRCIIVRKEQNENNKSSDSITDYNNHYSSQDSSLGCGSQKASTNILVSEFMRFLKKKVDFNSHISWSGIERSGHRQRTKPIPK
jgi:hypothetical protein